MSYVFRCGECDGDPRWQVVRIGDVVTTWACDEHLVLECERLQRDFEVTELRIKYQPKLAEVAEINRMIRSGFDGEPR